MVGLLHYYSDDADEGTGRGRRPPGRGRRPPSPLTFIHQRLAAWRSNPIQAGYEKITIFDQDQYLALSRKFTSEIRRDIGHDLVQQTQYACAGLGLHLLSITVEVKQCKLASIAEEEEQVGIPCGVEVQYDQTHRLLESITNLALVIRSYPATKTYATYFGV